MLGPAPIFVVPELQRVNAVRDALVEVRGRAHRAEAKLEPLTLPLRKCRGTRRRLGAEETRSQGGSLRCQRAAALQPEATERHEREDAARFHGNAALPLSSMSG